MYRYSVPIEYYLSLVISTRRRDGINEVGAEAMPTMDVGLSDDIYGTATPAVRDSGTRMTRSRTSLDIHYQEPYASYLGRYYVRTPGV